MTEAPFTPSPPLPEPVQSAAESSASTGAAIPDTAPGTGLTLAGGAPDLRQKQLHDWLATLPPEGPLLDLATLHLASSDAGFRRYFRVNGTTTAPDATSWIAMDAPPPEKAREFVQIQALLQDAGVAVPAILAADVGQGFMLLNDLGNTLYQHALKAEGADARGLMRDALSSLIRWQSASRPDVLPPYDDALLRRELQLFPEWYLERHLGVHIDAAMRATLESIFTLLIDSALAQPTLFVHRDFMPRNLMLKDGVPVVLDFQDAVMGPATYDVVSLFRDAFLSWDEDFELDGIAWYWGQAKAAGLPVNADFAQYYRDLEWMGLQRHLKILGLFARLHYRDGKPRYLEDAPRFLRYIRKVAGRYRELLPLLRLLDKVEGQMQQVGYTF